MKPFRLPYWRGLPASVLCLVLTAACQGANKPDSEAEAEAKNAAPKPDADNLRRALNAGYATPAGSRQECLGRLVFDAPRAMEWSYGSSYAKTNPQLFAKETGGHPQMFSIGPVNITIGVGKPREELKAELHYADVGKKNRIKELRDEIETKKRLIVKITEQKGELSDNARSAIADHQQEIAKKEASIIRIGKIWQAFELGLPDSAAYSAGNAHTAWLWRNGFLYTFEDMTYGLSKWPEGMTPESLKQRFVDLVRSFRPRKLYEVPKERGICIPYGFIPDEGDLEYGIGVQMRWADRPNVIYHWRTGTVGDHGSEATLFNATAAAAVGLLAGVANAEVASKLTHRIGPRQVALGGLRAEQGGVAINFAPKGKPPIPNYSVYTGYGGWGGSQMLPYILVDMQSYTPEQEPSFKTNPPPFEESLARLNAFLASMRFRPTDQPMPEMAQLPSTQSGTQ